MDRASRVRRSEEMLTRLGLIQRRNDLVRTFSKGMRQRISIACAIVHSPPVLFLDEPMTGPDVYSRRLVLDTVRFMNEEGSTVLITTHNLEEANELCSTIGIIDHGKILATGSPEKLKRQFDTTQYVEISFDLPVGAERFRAWAIARAEPWGDKWRVYAENADQAVKQVVARAEAEDLEIVSIATSSPSLEPGFCTDDRRVLMPDLRLFLHSVLMVAEKDMRIYYYKGGVVILGLLFPFIMFLTFFIGRNLDAVLFFPGFLGMMLFFSSSSTGPLITPWEKREKTYERPARTPPGPHREHRAGGYPRRRAVRNGPGPTCSPR